MTSVQPPVLDPPLGTPSNEWANNTTSSLDPPFQGTPQNTTPAQATGQSPGVTPRDELPGAFPDRDQGETSAGITSIAGTIVDAAKQYLPNSVVNTFLNGNKNPTGATGTDEEVRASEHDIYHKASLPSQELRGALPHEHVGGVGSLPGASIEKSVALLPDEQAEWSQWDTFAGRNTPGYQTPSNLRGNTTGPSQSTTQKATNPSVAADTVKADVPTEQPDQDFGKGYPETLTSGDISAAKQAVGNIKPVAFDIRHAHDVSMPSTETQGQQPEEHTGGVGSLPGRNDEQGVAVLPEERTTKTTEPVRPEHREELSDIPEETKTTGARGVGVDGATEPLKTTQPRGAQRSRQLDEPTIQLEPRVHPLGGDVSRWHGVNLGRRALEEWERAAASANDLPADTAASEPKTTGSERVQPRGAVDESENLASVKRSGSSEGSAEAQRKASLKEKISGGMKVFSGKLGHDKSKVEEGRKLMHGQLSA